MFESGKTNGSLIQNASLTLHSAFERKLKSFAEEREERRQKRMSRAISFPLSMSLSRRRSTSISRRSGEVDGVVVRGTSIKESRASESVPQATPSDHSFSTQMETYVPPTRLDLDLERGTGVAAVSTPGSPNEDDHIRFDEPPSHMTRPQRQHTRLFNGAGVGASDLSHHPRTASQSSNYHTSAPAEGNTSGPPKGLDKYLKTVNGLIGRNSQFHNLTHSEREALGGLEYQAVSLLSYIVPIYFVAWQLLGAVGVGAWINNNRPSTTRTNGLNPYWTGAFFAISAFNNSGMALLDANMTAFQTSYYVLLTLGLLILAGNTCYPPFLRLILWTMQECVPKTPKWQDKRRVIEFMLEHPRRVYTHLFPSQETWFLVGTLVALNGIDWFA